jgi:putative transcriptional regulator
MTQTEFSQWLGVSVNTVRNWEQGKRGPSGPAAALLGLVEVIPDEIAKALKKTSASPQENFSS